MDRSGPAPPATQDPPARAQGWALSMGLIALPYYHETNPGLAGIARRAIQAVLADGVGGAQ